MLDASQYSSREDLLRNFTPGGIWAEVGVASGSFSKLILKHVKPLRLFLIDSWGTEPGANLEQVANAKNGYDGVRSMFRDDPHVVIVKELSVPASHRYTDNSFSAVYIDADHTKAYEDAVAWWPKVKQGGYLLGHDYIDPKQWKPESFITVKEDMDRFSAERQLEMTVTKERYGTWVIKKW